LSSNRSILARISCSFMALLLQGFHVDLSAVRPRGQSTPSFPFKIQP
jgi:hypothetical protein